MKMNNSSKRAGKGASEELWSKTRWWFKRII